MFLHSSNELTSHGRLKVWKKSVSIIGGILSRIGRLWSIFRRGLVPINGSAHVNYTVYGVHETEKLTTRV